VPRAKAWLETARLFDEVAEQLKPYGLRTGYHNHWIEFQPLRRWHAAVGCVFQQHRACRDYADRHGQRPAWRGARDAVRAQIRGTRRHRPLQGVLSARIPNAIIGEGEVPWAEFFEACETVGGTEWYIVEQETYAHPPLETIRLCFEAMRRMGKV
jgi:hypothetical protein